MLQMLDFGGMFQIMCSRKDEKHTIISENFLDIWAS